jgi:tetratricopeptide (TPR) repeat protein
MKVISKLKDEARRHEQREEWDKAAQLYLEVLRVSEEGEADVELPLYNRIGDLYVRLGRPGDAVRYYEQAADRYADAGLYNNAIALCNKALRYQPDHLDLVRKLGQFSASQGFHIDARRYFLEFAERKFAAGSTDEALAALADFANVADDPEVRELLGRRLHACGRPAVAVQELQRAYEAYGRAGRPDRAAAVLETLRDIDPEAAETVLAAPAAPPAAPEPSSGVALPAGGLADLSFQAAGGDVADGALPERSMAVPPGGADEHAELAGGLALDGFGAAPPEPAEPLPDGTSDAIGTLEGLEATTLDFRAAAAELGGIELDFELEHDETSFDLPPLDDGTAAAGDTADALLLPTLDDVDADDRAALDLPGLDEGDDGAGLPGLDDATADDRAALDLPGLDEGDDDAGLPTLDDVDAASDATPSPFELPAVAEAAAPGPEPAPVAEPEGEWTPEASLPPAAVRPEPAAPPAGAGTVKATDTGSGFVDLGALIAGDEPEGTRFRVQETAPTGDEDRDFAELLNQFKAKVSEHLPAEDAAAHYDLGLAFKEMGLIDEAIAEFQIALRAGHMRLKVYEELGDCFLQKKQYNIAEKVLRRGLELKYDDELDLLGMYYHLGRAYEAMGRREQAKDAYERVLGMDINFQDVSARLAQL